MKIDKKTAKRIGRAKRERIAKAARAAAKRKRGLLRALVAIAN